MRYTFFASCSDLSSKEELAAHAAMRDEAVQISHRTFRRYVGGEELDRWAAAHGYDTGSERGGLRLSKDWHVGYFYSTWREQPCYFLVWSAFEMIWTPTST